jgi:hypothetical protein
LTFRRYFSFRTSDVEVRSEHLFSSKSHHFMITVSDVRNQKNTDVRNDHRKIDGCSEKFLTGVRNGKDTHIYIEGTG